MPDAVRQTSPDAKAYQPLKNVVKDAIKDKEVAGISLFVSDSNDYAISDWRIVHSEMGKLIYDAAISRKNVHIFVEYHPDLHNSLYERLPFINLKDNFPNCEISFIKDMGLLKTAAVIEYSNGRRSRYFTDDSSTLSFSNEWGAEGLHVYADKHDTAICEQDGPAYDIVPGRIIRDGISGIRTSFQVKNYFSKAIAPYVLKGGDENEIRRLLNGKHVQITVSDPYVNCALASLMLVYLIDEMKRMFGFDIETITLQVDSNRRNCDNTQFNDWTYISYNFNCRDDADEYTDQLCRDVLNVEPAHSDNTDHHRWLKIEASDGSSIELRPDHGFCGSFKSKSQYGDLDTLDGDNVWVYKGPRDKNDELYYLIINPAAGR